MQKVEDIKTPTNLKEFREGLKKYCLGSKDSIFIYNKINNTKVSVDINKISKMSDVFKFIKNDNVLGITAREFDVIIMCDTSTIKKKDLMMNEEDAIIALKEAYLFNNQDRDERNNFLNSTQYAIEIIKSGGKIKDEKDSKPVQTSIISQYLNDLYRHLFGEYFDTANTSKKEYHLSKYH